LRNKIVDPVTSFRKSDQAAVPKIFAMKNDPDRILREMADIKELLKLEVIDIQEIQKYFQNMD